LPTALAVSSNRPRPVSSDAFTGESFHGLALVVA
jgi:hypothetical protein